MKRDQEDKDYFKIAVGIVVVAMLTVALLEISEIGVMTYLLLKH